jgi:hypothetical protein
MQTVCIELAKKDGKKKRLALSDKTRFSKLRNDDRHLRVAVQSWKWDSSVKKVAIQIEENQFLFEEIQIMRLN